MVSSEGWQAKRNKAVQLVAADIMPTDKIAAEVGVKPRTLYAWLQRTEIKERIAQRRKEIDERVISSGVALKTNRIAKANERWMGMHQVIRERAADPINADIAGGTTGLLVHTLKGVGSGPAARVVDEWEVDTGLLDEIRAHEEQVSKELGQWPSPSGSGDTNVQIAVIMPGAQQQFAEPAVITIEKTR